MTDKLPPNLLALFQPRPPLRYIPPQDSAPEERAVKKSQLSGIAAFLPQLDDYKENDVYKPTESWLQKRDRKRYEKKLRQAEIEKPDFQAYRPNDDPKIKGDAVKTLFVGRLSYEVKEADLEREFGRFGPIERIRIVKDETTPKPKKPHKGYAFIVYEREKDMRGTFFYASPSALDPFTHHPDDMPHTKKQMACASKTEKSSWMWNVVAWSLDGDLKDSAAAWVEEDIPSKLLQDLRMAPLKVDMGMASEVASEVVVGSAADSVATSVATVEVLVAEEGWAIKEEAVSVDAADIKADLHRPTHPAALVEEAAMAEAMRTDEMVTEAEGPPEATTTLSAAVTEDMRTETETEIEIEIETRTVTDMVAADATMTMAPENDTTRTTGMMTPDNAGGTKHAHSISCVTHTRHLVQLTVGWVGILFTVP
ncbi:hypothetical protein CLCR_05903 [Cladophialophora carrionii]|uniref:RRM domain-containing protein n=1 Tax=Cladophialophora carrionii TaxID=86049 RepID=A0A1C1CA62_9EURO|nr:hypothetical protein CLCR_05903 [Cladophialophora carrionii]